MSYPDRSAVPDRHRVLAAHLRSAGPIRRIRLLRPGRLPIPSRQEALASFCVSPVCARRSFHATPLSCAQRGRTFSYTGSLAPPGRGPPVRLAVPGVRTAPGPHDRLSSVVNVPQGAHTGRASSWRGGHCRHRSRWPDSNGRSPAPKAGAFARLRYTSIEPSHNGRRDEEESNLWPPASQTGALSV